MRIADCVSQMSKLYLSRTVDSIIKEDVPRDDEQRLREQVNQNSGELASVERLTHALNLRQMRRDQRILFREILWALLEQPDNSCGDKQLYELVKSREQQVVDEANREQSFAYCDAKSLDIYKAVLQVALEDKEVTAEEFALIDKLRAKLKLSRREHRLLEAWLGYYPTPNNQLHGYQQFNEALKNLQTRGVLFYCNKSSSGNLVVLPEEIAPGVKKALRFEMTNEAQQRFHDQLTNEQLQRVLRSHGLPTSGTKSERSKRLIEAGVKPSEVLEGLQNNELASICRDLVKVKVSGSKDERRNRIIQYFDSYTVAAPEDERDSRALCYEYFEDLACRNNQALLRREIIKRDREMDQKFEEATRYLFEDKLGCSLVAQDGTDHPDGVVELPNGDLLMWDNKSKEQIYTFPKNHRDQFKKYIRESAKRVSVFLVIVPDVDPQAKLNALQLKHETDTDTDVAVIRASDLKYVAEHWAPFAKDGKFNPNIFNTTGVLDRSQLEEWMKVLL
jgi:hypothetical protein